MTLDMSTLLANAKYGEALKEAFSVWLKVEFGLPEGDAKIIINTALQKASRHWGDKICISTFSFITGVVDEAYEQCGWVEKGITKTDQSQQKNSGQQWNVT